jgi:hypothetical protein
VSGTGRITNSPHREVAGGGPGDHVRCYRVADTLAAAGAEVHLAHPLGLKALACRPLDDTPACLRTFATLISCRSPKDRSARLSRKLG